ncbi:MAG: hypothetical protein KatS3mg104_3029 [Phycisphaerae bacterium]|nr:MAG: hypothetical protein KatS3mg104_3029 [Phycisphaerae bacterium]
MRFRVCVNGKTQDLCETLEEVDGRIEEVLDETISNLPPADETQILVVEVYDHLDEDNPDCVWADTIAVQPDEPGCVRRKGHDWRQTKNWNNGAMICAVESCNHCGLQKLTIKNFVVPATGEYLLKDFIEYYSEDDDFDDED